MKKLLKSIYLILLFLLLIPFKSFGQKTEPIDSTKIKLMIAAKEIMNAASTCALITLDDKGRPRVRAMDPFSPENNFTVWFGTNSKSRKVNQIKKDHRVTLYYLDHDSSGYVMIHGIAQLINDQKEKENRWKEEWEDFYPNRIESYLLIKVSPIWLEISSVPRGIVGDSITWQPPEVSFDSKL